MDLQLENKVALVGGASRGIGKAIVEVLLAEGCRVACCARSEVADDNWAGGKAAGDRLDFRTVDLRDHAAVSAWVAEAAAHFGSIDILVGNASALSRGNDIEAWQTCLDVDVLALQTAVNAARPWLERAAAASGDAAVIGISSVSASLTAAPAAYGAIKAAQVHYVKGLSHQLAASGVRANTVSPGSIYFDDGTWGRIKREDPDQYQMVLSRNPLGRMGTPEEIANVVAFLVSPRASFVSGANIVADGAMTTQLML